MPTRGLVPMHLSMFIAHDEKYQDSIIACNGLCSPQLDSDKIENKKIHFICDLQLALHNKSQKKDHFAWSQKATARERVMTMSAWLSGRRKFNDLLIRSKSWFFMIVLRNSRQHNSWTGPKIFFQQIKMYRSSFHPRNSNGFMDEADGRLRPAGKLNSTISSISAALTCFPFLSHVWFFGGSIKTAIRKSHRKMGEGKDISKWGEC